MKKWFKRFWEIHGMRLFFGGLAFGFSLFFLGQQNEQLQGAGLTILIGLAMECYRQARGGAVSEEINEPDPQR